MNILDLTCLADAQVEILKRQLNIYLKSKGEVLGWIYKCGSFQQKVLIKAVRLDEITGVKRLRTEEASST